MQPCAASVRTVTTLALVVLAVMTVQKITVAECLERLRDHYYGNGDECLSELVKQVDIVDPDWDSSAESVQQKLLELLEHDAALDVLAASEKAKLCAVLGPPKPRVQHVGTDPNSRHAFPCPDTYKLLPAHPSAWPQAPIMIRPTPNTSTVIRGIRRAGSTEYEHFKGFCAGCILPVNSGNEAPGNSLVIDFESPHFTGTMLMRIKQAPANIQNKEHMNDRSYFDGKKRKFQAVVRGRFKTPLPISECVTGQVFDRPAGKLPARWIVTSFIRFVSTLAPQLEARLDGQRPRFLTPLVATAHTVLTQALDGDADAAPLSLSTNGTLEDGVEEPASNDESSILREVAASVTDVSVPDTSKSSVGSRMKARKKLFNSIAAKHNAELTFRTDREYTFEFYQHLLDFGDQLAVDMGRPIGKVGLAQATDGQPIKFMSAHKSGDALDSLWSFDIWHSSLFPYAEMAEEQRVG